MRPAETEHLDDEIERILEISLALHLVLLALETVGDGGEQGSHELLKLCDVALAKTIGNVQNPRCILSDIGEISGSDSVNKSISHFFVREVEKICVVFYIAVLDCEIAALVNHWQGLLHVSQEVRTVNIAGYPLVGLISSVRIILL